MAGVEKMKEAIIADAKKEADAIIATAKEEADKEKNSAFAEISANKGKKQKTLENELEDYRLRAESARDLQRRRLILAKKQEIISNIIEKTWSSLHDADTNTYFSSLYKMFEKYCQPETGVMHLNSKDLGRMPSDFSSRIEQIAKSKGGNMEISKNEVEIEDGFILTYSGTEENCTFRSLIESEKEYFFDEINKMLWRDANG